MRVRVPPGALGLRHDVRMLLAAKSFFDGTAAMVFFMVVLVLGYAVCFGLWWFVFRKPHDEDERPAGPPHDPLSGGK
jgi:hypothetical protein